MNEGENKTRSERGNKSGERDGGHTLSIMQQMTATEVLPWNVSPKSSKHILYSFSLSTRKFRKFKKDEQPARAP